MKLRKVLKLHFFAMLMTTGVSHAQTSSTEVLLATTAGTIRIALYDETPLHRDNFLKHCREHRYDSLLFHRVINNFMIQAGDIHSKHAQPGQLLGGGDLNYTVKPEFRLPSIYHCRGAVAMAREGDSRNPEMRSSACQFYIVTRRNGTPHLDGKYTVFGIVKEGMEIADQIQTVATDQFDRPLKDIRILSTKIIESVQLPADSIRP